MPITSNMVVAGKGNRANKGASPFGAGQVGSVPDSPQFYRSGGNTPEHSEVVTDPGNPTPVQSVVPQAAPSPGAPGDVGSEPTPTASGSDAGTNGTSGSGDVTATFPNAPGDRGSNRSAPIVGTTPNE